MQKRVIFSVLLSIVIILISLGIISYLRITDSINRSLQNRLDLATIIGKYIDDILESNLTRLYDISISGRIDFDDDDWSPEKKALKTAYEYSIFTDRIFLLDLLGNVVLTYPHQEGGKINLLSIPYISKTLSEKRPVISDIYNMEPTKRKVIFALVPLKNKNGEFIGIAGGEMNPTNYMFSRIIKSIPLGPDTYTELIDSHGTIIASNDPKRILMSCDHNEFLGKLIARKKTSVATCHRCHEKGNTKMNRTEDMLAFAPLSVAPWGISIREPQDVVFSPATELKRGFLVLGLIAVATALMLAIGMSRSIVRPIQALINATQRIGRGNLSEPLQITSRDEIGTLAQSFEDMRVKLAESLKSIQEQNIELEKRVSERTAELQRNRERLANLLDEVIKAEEDERMRVARELHDETSQSLAALGMSIDIAEMALKENSLTPDGIKELKQKLNYVLDGINLLIRDLRPPVLDDLGFEAGIQWLLERHLGEKGIEYSSFTTNGFRKIMSTNGHPDFIKRKTELMIFRVIQEAITNIAKHAHASHVFVYLGSGRSSVNVYIEDDGIGFDANEVITSGDSMENAGFGIIGMKERIGLLDGDLSICTEPDAGTAITVEIPFTSLGIRDVED